MCLLHANLFPFVKYFSWIRNTVIFVDLEFVTITLTEQMFNSHLWCDVVRGAAEGACGHAFVHVLLAHAEIRDLDVALGVQHYVVQLQIPTVETCFCFVF